MIYLFIDVLPSEENFITRVKVVFVFFRLFEGLI